MVLYTRYLGDICVSTRKDVIHSVYDEHQLVFIFSTPKEVAVKVSAHCPMAKLGSSRYGFLVSNGGTTWTLVKDPWRLATSSSIPA